MEEPIRVFSDLHLAHPGCRIDAVASLAPLFEGAGTVIFNGDTCEQRHSALIANGRRLLEELRSVLREAGVKRTIFLRGNHDPEISDLDHLDLANGRILVTHGDAIFRHLSPWSPKIWPVIPRMDAIRAEYEEAKLGKDLETRLEYTHRCRTLSAGTGLEFTKSGAFSTFRSLARIAWPPRRPIQILKTWATIPREADEFLERYRPGARLLIFGHTHLPGAWQRHDRTVLNTGGFMSLMPARGIEIRGGTLEVFSIEERGFGICRGRTLRGFDLG
ncbi:MAG: metallophosphoesterase family protein [Verrucomicrobiae bacterium]|nr:metallophosphoesterase family protein [Verrucomicrobiae bacterium]